MPNCILPRVLWLVAMLAAAPALAQVLYKSTMPDGRVVYGDKPAPGAAKVEESKPDTSKAGIVPPTAGETAVLKRLETERLKREAASDKVQAAEQALREAEAARDGGREPLAGERLGTVSGAQRLTDAYWARQKKLEDDVEKARRALEKLRSGQ